MKDQNQQLPQVPEVPKKLTDVVKRHKKGISVSTLVVIVVVILKVGSDLHWQWPTEDPQPIDPSLLTSISVRPLPTYVPTSMSIPPGFLTTTSIPPNFPTSIWMPPGPLSPG